jgi:ClpP class serine protease
MPHGAEFCDRDFLGPNPASLIKVVEQKPIERIDDQTLVFADVGRKAIEQVRRAARDVLGGRMADDAADKLAHKLSEGTWTLDYPISATEAKALGLNVSTDMPSRHFSFPTGRSIL